MVRSKTRIAAGLIRDLRSYWNFSESNNENGLATRLDAMGLNHLTPNGGPVFYKRGTTWGARGGGAFFSPSTGAFLQKYPCPDNLSRAPNLTICFRLLISSAPADGDFATLFWKSLPGLRIELVNDGGDLRIRFLRAFGVAEYEVVSGPIENAIVWGKYIFVRAWTTADGVMGIQVGDEETKITTADSPLDALGDLAMGGRPDASHFLDGAMDEVGLWLRDLTDDEVDYLLNTKPAPTFSDWVAGPCRQINCCD
jgi:hypothetical protein